MIMKLYAVYDRGGQFYGRPFPSQTHMTARRVLEAAANDPKTDIAMYPAEYELCFIGEYNDATGKLTSLESPEMIVSAAQCVRKPPVEA